jgi:hypothetical protein
MATALPIPLADPADPAARLLSGLAASGPAQVFAALSNATVRSIEVELRPIRAKIELGRTEAALNHLARISQDDWRVGWYRGLANLAAGGTAALTAALATALAGLILVGVLGWLQLWLSRRFRRRFNPALLTATAAALTLRRQPLPRLTVQASWAYRVVMVWWRRGAPGPPTAGRPARRARRSGRSCR